MSACVLSLVNRTRSACPLVACYLSTKQYGLVCLQLVTCQLKNKHMDIKINNLETIDEAARQFIDNMGRARVFAFYGKMGAGKTTFVKAVCRRLGVDDVITSPTFAIVNEYTSATTGDTIYHFDFYRIKKLDEVYDMGYEEYFYGGNLCFIEWPELVESLLPEDAVKVTISEAEDGTRTVSF